MNTDTILKLDDQFMIMNNVSLSKKNTTSHYYFFKPILNKNGTDAIIYIDFVSIPLGGHG